MKSIKTNLLFGALSMFILLTLSLSNTATSHAQIAINVADLGDAPESSSSGESVAMDAYLIPGQEAGSATKPCLEGDPFQLANLRAAISSPTPPTAPVFIGRHTTVQWVRSAQMTGAEDEELPTGARVRGTPLPEESTDNALPLGVMPLRIYNVRTGHEFRVVTSEAMLKEIFACHETAGMTEANSAAADDEAGMGADLPSFVYLPLIGQGPSRSVQDVAAPLMQTRGWANGTDSRVMRTPTTLWPWRTITQSSSWPNGEDSVCTMTLIGPRHLITAAHCLVDFGTSNWKNRKLTPGRDGIGISPYGASQMTPNPPPGEDAWYIVPDPWLDPSTPDDGNQYQWDIGIVLMLDRLGDQTGWMGYGAYPASDLNQRNQLNRGYPRCRKDYAEEPAACPKDDNDSQDAVARLFGDIGYCDVGVYHNQGSNGWNREFSFSCDLSRGHSGSPLYHYRYSPSQGKNIPVVAAVVSWHECTTCGPNDDYPNHARRITPWVRDLISWLRETFP